MLDTVTRALIASLSWVVIVMAFRFVVINHISRPARVEALHTIALMLIPLAVFWSLLAIFGRFEPWDLWLSRVSDLAVIGGSLYLIGLIRQEES